MKFKQIRWKKGTGSVVIGMVSVVVCFTVALAVMEQGNLFYRTVRTQMLSDTVADGASVWAQTPLSVDEYRLKAMAEEIVDRNRRGAVQYTLQDPLITNDGSRPGYDDKIITVYLDASADSIPVPDVPSSSTQIHVGSKVRALSRLPSSIPLTEPEQRVVQQALQSLSPDCAQYKAILQSVTMKNWLYSEKERWTEGYCDCSSFLISSFRVAEQNYGVSGNSQSMMAIARDNGWYHDWIADTSLVAELQPGDVLYWSTPYATEKGLPYGLGHVGMYLGQGKIIHASPSAGRVVITNLFGESGDTETPLIGYSRQN